MDLAPGDRGMTGEPVAAMVRTYEAETVCATCRACELANPGTVMPGTDPPRCFWHWGRVNMLREVLEPVPLQPQGEEAAE